MVDKTFLKRWVKALRSGEFKQGQYALIKKTSDRVFYCCLGVACYLKAEDEGMNIDNFRHPIKRSELADGWLLPEDEQFELVGMNDDSGKTFSEIADYIEQTYINPS